MGLNSFAPLRDEPGRYYRPRERAYDAVCARCGAAMPRKGVSQDCEVMVGGRIVHCREKVER